MVFDSPLHNVSGSRNVEISYEDNLAISIKIFSAHAHE